MQTYQKENSFRFIERNEVHKLYALKSQITLSGAARDIEPVHPLFTIHDIEISVLKKKFKQH